MIINDIIYDKEEIIEPVLLDLINSKEFNRLKNVSQLGLPDDYYFKKGFTRYEHSLGVLILLRRMGASIEEQIVGLLHDINHTAFSHVIDWIEGDPTKENHQDDHLLEYILNSNLPKILERNGFDIGLFENYKEYGLLERDAPKLCADRLDYSLREIAVDGNINLTKKIYSDLISISGQIVFKNLDIAKEFYQQYSSLNRNGWASSDARMRYFLLSQSLRKAFDLEILSKEDLFLGEMEIIEKLYGSKNELILKNLFLLKNGFVLYESEEGVLLEKKHRYIDPEVLEKGSYLSLSDIDESYKKIIEDEKKKGEIPMRMIAKIK